MPIAVFAPAGERFDIPRSHQQQIATNLMNEQECRAHEVFVKIRAIRGEFHSGTKPCAMRVLVAFFGSPDMNDVPDRITVHSMVIVHSTRRLPSGL